MKGCCTKPVLLTCAILLFLVVAQEKRVEAAAPCDPMQLFPCEDAMRRGSAPSKECCTRVWQQQHCFCQYLRNPTIRAYLTSPNARKVATACQLTYPKC